MFAPQSTLQNQLTFHRCQSVTIKSVLEYPVITTYLKAVRYSTSPIGGSTPPVHAMFTLKPTPAADPTCREREREGHKRVILFVGLLLLCIVPILLDSVTNKSLWFWFHWLFNGLKATDQYRAHYAAISAPKHQANMNINVK